MAKTTEQIIQAHKQTIEAYNPGKECSIVLIDKKDAGLKQLSLTEILNICEEHNTYGHFIKSKSRLADVVTIRRIFCLIAALKCGKSARSIGMFLNNTHTSILHHLSNGKNLLINSDKFKRLHTVILNDVITHAQKGSGNK